MSFLLLAGILVPTAFGWAVLQLLWPRESKPNTLLMIVLGAGIGFGLTSCLLFLWLAASGGDIAHWPILSCVMTAIMLCLVAFKFKRNKRTGVLAERQSFGAAELILLLALVGFGWLFVIHTHLLPNGEWDAWSIWNLHARFMVRGGQYWTDAFKPDVTPHGDYPLLVPGTVAEVWSWRGSDGKSGPIAMGATFCLAVILLVYLFARRHGSPLRGLAGALLLMGTPFFLSLSTWQYADIPLAFYVLASCALLIEHDRNGNGRGLLALAGMTAAMAAWTKNEGILYFLIFMAVSGILFWRGKGLKDGLRQSSVMLLGAAPVLATLLIFKLAYAPANDLVSQAGAGEPLIIRLTDPERWRFVITKMASGLLNFGEWRISGATMISPVPIMALWLFATGVGKRAGAAALTSALTLGLMIVGYWIVYMTSPHDLEWHFSTSLHRVLMQLWPAGIMLFCVTCAPFPISRKGTSDS